MIARVSSAACVLGMSALLLVAGCAGPGTCRWGDRDTGIILEYRVPEEAPLRYRLSSTLGQTMEIPGRPVEMKTVQKTVLSLALKKGTGDDLRVTVGIDSLDLLVTAPDQKITADATDAIGRSFSMLLSRLGEEKDFPDPDKIQYDMGEAGKRSAISTLQMMFPDLAGRPLAVGDTWVGTEGFSENAEGGSVEISITSEYTLEGFETIHGLKCARISGSYTGTTTGGGTQGPAEWTSKGAMEGTTTMYFAYEEGIFVRETSSGAGTSTISAVGPDGNTMEIPVSQVMDFETTLLR